MARMNLEDARPVYSSEQGRLCPDCGQPVKRCQCARQSLPATDGVVRVRYETKGRKGKGVTVITGIPLDAGALKALAKELKKLCGSGGAIKQGAVEIQGDHRAAILPLLQRQGWTVKLVGG